MSQELYSDQIGEITVTGSVVRIDLVSLSATQRDEQNQPKAEFRQRIVMPLDGFIRSFRLMAQVVKQLGGRDTGQAKAAESSAQAAAPAGEPPAAASVLDKRSEPLPAQAIARPAGRAAPARPASPNFK